MSFLSSILSALSLSALLALSARPASAQACVGGTTYALGGASTGCCAPPLLQAAGAG